MPKYYKSKEDTIFLKSNSNRTAIKVSVAFGGYLPSIEIDYTINFLGNDEFYIASDRLEFEKAYGEAQYQLTKHMTEQ